MQVGHLGLTYLLLASLLCIVQSASAPLTIGPSIKYSYSGTRVFDTSGYYSSGPSTVSGLVYSIPFVYAMNDTGYKSTIALQQIYAELNNRQFNLYFELDSKQQGALNFLVYSNMMNKIQAMTFRYLVVASTWGTFSGYWQTYTVSPGHFITNTSPYVDISTGLSPVNFSSTIRVFAVLTGFDIVAATSVKELSLLIDVIRISSTSSQLTLSTYSSLGITLNTVSYSQLAIDINEINAIPGRVHIGTFNASSGGTLSYLDTANIAMQYNTIVGLRGFHINNESFLSWNLTINPGVSIDGSSNNAFLFFNFIYLILQENWCPYHIPYLLIANSTCYDICPERYYSRQLSWICESCLYDCYMCTGPTNCTQCNQTSDYRQMDNTTSRCLPIQGYYDDGANHSSALPCVDPCLTCTSASVCLSCNLTYYLSGGACLPCAPNCLNCTSNTSCIQCFTPYEVVSGSCDLNCTAFVSNCYTCEVVNNTVDVNCTSCQLGFFLDISINNCSIVCGDGILASTESCDDGNLVNGDGCDDTCTIEAAFYCQGALGNTSNCSSCSDHCLNCTSSVNCSLCQVLYIVNGSNCTANCSEVEYCINCSVVYGATGEFVQCSACSGGYSVDPSLNECKPICGDGLLAPEEECDDDNLNAGDGCSRTCQVETYFVCNQSSTTNISKCFLTHLQLQLITIYKSSGQNTGVMHFKPTPAGLPLFESLNWSNLLSIDSSNIDVASVRYDPATGEVLVNFNYNATIDSHSLIIALNTTRDSSLSKITNSSVLVKATASNNQALVYYSDDNYQLANIVKYLSLACSGCAILFLLIGVITGKLIGLECAALIQLSFISLLTLQNISPSFAALSFLGYSLGYNKIKGYDLGQEVDRPFKGIEISQSFIYNYNLMSVFILLALLLGIVFKVIATASSQQKMGMWLKRAKLAAGEYALYFFLFFSYLAYLSLLVEFKYRSATQGMMSFISIGAGALTIILGIVYMLVYCCGQSCFSEFKDKFQQGFGKKYYIMPIIQRIASPALVVLFVANFKANIGVIVLSAVLAGVILKGQPYKGHRKNWRPFANYLLAVIIQLIFVVVGMTSDPASMLALYGPLLVVALLLICVIYSAYALVKEFRQYLQSKQKQQSEEGDEEDKMREFAETMMRETNASIFRKSSYCQEGGENGKECGSPSRLQVITIRDRLQSLKMTHRSDREQLLEKSANQGNLIEMPSEFSDSI